MTGVCWYDDAQVVEWSGRKVYAYADVAPLGVVILVRRLD